MAPEIVSHAKIISYINMYINMSHLDYCYHPFPVPITVGFFIPICKSVSFFTKRKNSNIPLDINKGMLCCIVKLPDEVYVCHMKCAGEINYKNSFNLRLKQFAEVLLTGLTLEKVNILKKIVFS